MLSESSGYLQLASRSRAASRPTIDFRPAGQSIRPYWYICTRTVRRSAAGPGVACTDGRAVSDDVVAARDVK